MCEWPKTTASASESGPQPLRAARRRAGVVDYADPRLAACTIAAAGSAARTSASSTLPCTATTSPVALKLAQHRQRDQVAGVNDQIRVAQPLDALVRQRRASARHVRVRDDCDLHDKLVE